jgi:aminocarboxymuconate-semialdehyde decarboxylase
MNNPPAIDIHAHYYPESYIRLIEKHGSEFGASVEYPKPDHPIIRSAPTVAVLEPRFIDLDERIADMDRTGVDVHALSMTMPMIIWAGDELRRKLVEAHNDASAEAHEKHPTRLVGLAMLPWHDPQQALAELERVSQLPGFRGVYSETRIDMQRELDDESLYPVYERLEDMGWAVFLHPVHIVEPQRLQKYFLGNLIGNPVDTGIAAAHLIFGGILDRYPRLEFCLPHAGGIFPMLVGRMNRGWEMKKGGLKGEGKGPKEYLRRFHYDTIAHSEDVFAFLIEQVGADRIMLGSDYCFDLGYDHPVEVVSEHPGLDKDSQAMILGGNAKRLLGI